jgi:hypothetical protein
MGCTGKATRSLWPRTCCLLRLKRHWRDQMQTVGFCFSWGSPKDRPTHYQAVFGLLQEHFGVL